MALSWRQGAVFGSGLAVGVAAAWIALRPHAAPAPASPSPASVIASPQQKLAVTPTQAACPGRPAVTAAANGDGQLRLPAEAAAKSAADVAAAIVAGKEAAAAGRPHDAELSFLAACRMADKLAGADPLPGADARYQLARHYATLALSGEAGAGARRDELLARADVLYADSLQTFRARYGEAHEKSRFAADGLASVRQGVAQAGKPAQPAAAAPKPAAPKSAEVAKAVVPETPTAGPQPRPVEAAAPAPVRQASGHATRVAPSFDCGKARSPAEKTICSDTELAQLDRDLGRLHARAKSAATDAAAFRRQNDREWLRRESTCRSDRDCLLRWYAQRRDQLETEVDEERE